MKLHPAEPKWKFLADSVVGSCSRPCGESIEKESRSETDFLIRNHATCLHASRHAYAFLCFALLLFHSPIS